jgi:hypothetical protein
VLEVVARQLELLAEVPAPAREVQSFVEELRKPSAA